MGRLFRKFLPLFTTSSFSILCPPLLTWTSILGGTSGIVSHLKIFLCLGAANFRNASQILSVLLAGLKSRKTQRSPSIQHPVPNAVPHSSEFTLGLSASPPTDIHDKLLCFMVANEHMYPSFNFIPLLLDPTEIPRNIYPIDGIHL